MLGRLFNNPEKYEETALELLLTGIKTGRIHVDLERARERYAQMGEVYLSQLLERVISSLDAGASPVDAFYSVNLLSPETYSLLKVAEESEALSEGFIRDLIQVKREKEKAKGKVRSAITTPILMVGIMSVISAFVIQKIVNILQGMKEGGTGTFSQIEINPFYIFVAKAPLLGALVISGVSVALMIFIISMWFKRSGQFEMKVMSASKVLALLRMQGVDYEKIFRILSSFEKDKALKRIYEQISLSVSELPIQDAVKPLLEALPVNVAVVFVSMVERGDEVEAWSYVNQKMTETFERKMEMFEENAPKVANAFVAIILMMALYPLKSVMALVGSAGGMGGMNM